MVNKITFILILLFIFISACDSENNTSEYTGILEGISIKIPAMTGGKIIEISVREGIEIAKGQILAIVDTTELGFNNEQLKAGIEDLQVQREMKKTNLSRVNKNYNYINEKHKRINKLYHNNSVSKQALDDITNKLESAEAVLISAKQSLLSLEARHKQLEAQVKTVKKKINDAVIKSPVSGIITGKFFEIGEAVPPMSPVVEIININTLETKIYISEKRLPSVKYNQKVTVKIDGLDQVLAGKIDWISPKAEFTPKTILTPETRTSLVYAVKVSIENPNGVLKHGMPVVIELKNID